MEIDLTRQILILLDGDSVLKVLHCSTGMPGWDTPPGSFNIQWKINAWRQSSLGFLYKPSYFYDGMAIHGGYTVQVYPSSHGCVRIHNWETDEIFSGNCRRAWPWTYTSSLVGWCGCPSMKKHTVLRAAACTRGLGGSLARGGSAGYHDGDGRLAQGESASLTRKRPQVQILCAHAALADARATAGLLSHYIRSDRPLPRFLGRSDRCGSGRASGPRSPLSTWLLSHPTGGSGSSAAAALPWGAWPRRAPRSEFHPEANSYLALLDRVLLDRQVSRHEEDELVSVAEMMGLAREDALSSASRLSVCARQTCAGGWDSHSG